MAENPKNNSNQDYNRTAPQGDANKPQKPAGSTTVGNPDRANQNPKKEGPGADQDRDRNKTSQNPSQKPAQNPNQNKDDKDRMNRGPGISGDEPDDDNAATRRVPKADRGNLS